jgi:hypothetical protein
VVRRHPSIAAAAKQGSGGLGGAGDTALVADRGDGGDGSSGDQTAGEEDGGHEAGHGHHRVVAAGESEGAVADQPGGSQAR